MGCTSAKSVQVHGSSVNRKPLSKRGRAQVRSSHSTISGAGVSRGNTSLDDACTLNLGSNISPQNLFGAAEYGSTLAQEQDAIDSVVVESTPFYEPSIAPQKFLGTLDHNVYAKVGNKIFVTDAPALMIAARYESVVPPPPSPYHHADEAEVAATEPNQAPPPLPPPPPYQHEDEAEVVATEHNNVPPPPPPYRHAEEVEVAATEPRNVPPPPFPYQHKDEAKFAAEPCPICMDAATEGLLRLTCGHAAHKACLEAMIAAKWTGKRITFNYMNCFMCRHELHHPELESILAPHKELRRKVRNICLNKCEKERLIDNLSILMEKSPEQAEAAAAAEIACFECTECKEPYAAGRVDCGVEEGIDVSALRCADCHWKSPSEHKECKCSKHGAEDAIIKCDWCCNIAMFTCGAGRFCSECHQPPYAHTMPLHDPKGNEVRKVGQGQHCPGPDKCPLGMPHPPNGKAHRAFVIGCIHGCS